MVRLEIKGEIGSCQEIGIFPNLSETAGNVTVSLIVVLLGEVRSSSIARARLPN